MDPHEMTLTPTPLPVRRERGYRLAPGCSPFSPRTGRRAGDEGRLARLDLVPDLDAALEVLRGQQPGELIAIGHADLLVDRLVGGIAVAEAIGEDGADLGGHAGVDPGVGEVDVAGAGADDPAVEPADRFLLGDDPLGVDAALLDERAHRLAHGEGELDIVLGEDIGALVETGVV